MAAGAIPLGKTNLDQFATGLVGTRSPYGETHNALRPELISGDSSSGSAVAVARGQAVFALGTDTAGSGRVPAALHGLIGWKPSLGAWPTLGAVPACASLDCVTVFAHSLDDALLVDRAVRGVHDADPWSHELPEPLPELPAKLVLPKGELGFYGPFAEGYRTAWEAARERALSLGLAVEEVETELFARAAAILYEGPWVAERWADLGDFVESHPGASFPVTEKILRTGACAEYDAASVFRAMHRLQAYKLEARRLLRDAVLLMPTAGGTWTRDEVREDPVGTNRDMGRYTNHCNLLDLCAVAVPAGEAEERTPFGVTLFALAENEGLIAVAAEAFLAGGVGSVPGGVSGLAADSTGGTGAGAELSAGGPLPEARPGTTLVAVCGLHMRGFPLEKQMLECGAVFVREMSSAPRYQLVKLPTVPAKPGDDQEAGGRCCGTAGGVGDAFGVVWFLRSRDSCPARHRQGGTGGRDRGAGVRLRGLCGSGCRGYHGLRWMALCDGSRLNRFVLGNDRLLCEKGYGTSMNGMAGFGSKSVSLDASGCGRGLFG